MSIVSAVYVPEGIAMAADSRLTGSRQRPDGGIDRFILSDNTQKLFLIKDLNIGISSCGDAMINGKSIADFIRLFEIERIDRKTDNIQTFTEKLRLYLSESTASLSTAFYICGYMGDNAFTYSVTKDLIVCKHQDNNYGAT